MPISTLASLRSKQLQQRAGIARSNRLARRQRNDSRIASENVVTSNVRGFDTPNPRASGNQAGAARPTTDFIVGGARLATDGSLGSRGAETRAGIQNAGLSGRGVRGTGGLGLGVGMIETPEDSPERRAGIFAMPATHFALAPDIADTLRRQGVIVPEDNVVGLNSRAFREGQILGAGRPDALRPSEVTELTRREAGAPLGAGAGAGGQRGATGFNPDGSGVSGRTTISSNDPLGRQINELDEEINNLRNTRTERIYGGGVNESPTDVAIREAARIQKITDLENQKTQLLNRKIMQETFEIDAAAGLDTDVDFGGFTDIDGDSLSTSPELAKIFAENPMLANAYQPLIDALQSQDNNAAMALMMTLQSVGTGAEAAQVAIEATRAASEFATKNQSLLTESRDLKRDLADEKLAQATAERSQFQMKQSFLINQKTEQNIERELQNRRIAARMGIETDTGGLGWMQREARQAQDTLLFMQQATNIQSAEMSRRAASEHSLSIRSALGQYDASLLTLEKNLDDALGEIQRTLNLNEKERAKTIQDAYGKYMDTVNTKDIELAKIYRDANKTLYDNMVKQNEQRVKDQDRAFDFESGLIGLFNKNSILKESQDITTAFAVMEGAKTRFDKLIEAADRGEKINFGAVQQAMGVAFQKLLDPGSVVRESEFDRTAKGQPLWETLEGQWVRLEKGGIGLTEKTFMELYNTALELKEAHMKLYTREMQPLINQATRFNSFQPAVKVDMASVVPKELHSLLERDDFKKSYDDRKKMYDDLRKSVPGTGGATPTVTPVEQPKFTGQTDTPPPSGRQVNPTANPTGLSGDLVTQAGLKEGEDFHLNPDGTAEFFGDPGGKMVEVMKSVGFFTETGAKRFQDPSLSGVQFPTKKEFNGWQEQKQFEFIRMIQRIGANKELFGLSNNKRFRFLNVA